MNTTKTEILRLRIEPALKDLAQSKAAEMSIPLSALVRQSLELTLPLVNSPSTPPEHEVQHA